MELRHVRHFVAVAEHGSLGRAANALGVSQPALSKSVRRLEDELGVTLLERGPRGSVLSRYGEAFAPHARAIVVEAHNATLSVDALRLGHRGELAIGISPSLARQVVPIATARLLAPHTGQRMRVETGMVDDLLGRLRKGTLDLTITAMPQEYADPELVHEKLSIDRLDVVARVGHPLRERTGLGLADLAGHSWVIPSGAASGRSALARAFLAARLPMPDPVLETDSITFIRAFLPYTDFLSLLPLSLVETGDGPREVAPIEVAGHAWTRPIMATWRRGTSPSPVARRLLNDVRTVLDGVRPITDRRTASPASG